MERNKIDNKYKWDLDTIYKDDNSYNADIEEVKKLTEEELSYEGKVLSSSSNLLKILELETKIERILDRLYVFVSLNYNLDTRQSTYSQKLSNLMDLYSEISVKTSFISDELSKLTQDTLDKFLKEEKGLSKYKFSLEKVIRHAKYILPIESEKLLANLAPVLDGGSEVFDKLDNADIKLSDVKDEKGNTLPLTQGLYSSYIKSPDRTLRKNALYSMHEYYKSHENSLSECLFNHIKTNAIISKLRGYNSPLEASLMQDDLTESFYNKVIDDTHKNLSVLHRLMKIYKKALELDEMHIYDINAQMCSISSKKYSIEEMQNIIRNSLSIMGDEYLEVVDKAFNEHWVDYYETRGKTSGAFSSGSYDTKPYILLNYTGSFDDVETLTHELGHSIHSYYSKKSRGPEDYQYPIFLAEIASTTHEILLNDYLLKNSTDIEMKKYILNNILNAYKSTVFRQVEFGEFEKIIYDKISNGENVTKDDFTSIYLDLQNKYYGGEVIMDDIIKYECLRIPHFYTSFYVYKYATSLCIAYRFASDIINHKPGAVQNYMKLITSGGKDYPLNILKECGIDLNKEDLMIFSIELIEKYMDEFEKIYLERSNDEWQQRTFMKH